MKKVMLYMDGNTTKLPIGWVEFNEEMVDPKKQIIKLAHNAATGEVYHAVMAEGTMANPFDSLDDLMGKK